MSDHHPSIDSVIDAVDDHDLDLVERLLDYEQRMPTVGEAAYLLEALTDHDLVAPSGSRYFELDCVRQSVSVLLREYDRLRNQ